MAVTKNIQGFEAEQEEFKACAECTQKCRSSHKKGNNNNNNGSPSCFFKVLLGDFANVLRIPPAFVGRLQIGFQNAFLEGPSGQIWLVAVCRTDTGMTFEKGWQTFVSDHSLDVGDFLVFKYVGESYFTVQIFGRTCCEKKDAYTVRKSEPCRMSDGPKKQQKCREGSAEISHGVSDDACIDPRNMTNRVSQGHELPTSAPFIKSNTVQVDNSRKREQCINSKDSVGSEEDMTKVESTGFLDKGNEAGFSVGKAVFLGAEGESTKKALKKGNFYKSTAGACASQYHVDNPTCDVTPVQPIKKTKITSQKLQTPKNGGKRRVSAHYVYCSQPVKKTKVTPQKLQTPMDERKQYVSAHYVSCRREVTQKERENALKAAQSFQSDNPFNLIVMKQSQVYQGFWLSLSRDFSKRWLPDRRIEITLLGPCGNKWPVQYLGDRSNPGLSGGWKGFAIDKNLEEGDVCVFELENKENCVLKVHIYRVVEDCTPPRKVEGVRRKNEESEKKSVPVKKLSTKKRDTADTNKEKKRPQSTPNSGIKTEPQQVKANQGSPSVTSDAFKTVPKMEM